MKHACKIKKTANGGRSRVGRQARADKHIKVKRCLEEHVQVYESATTERAGEDEAEIAAHAQAKIGSQVVRLSSFQVIKLSGWRDCTLGSEQNC